uniref:Pleckstrin homology domain containing, family G (with RhoGef domain) member 2 n=1 Tax=Pygocentrus nattereri TaxID=42514 RepID=A0A3B4C0H4_PYGNA
FPDRLSEDVQAKPHTAKRPSSVSSLSGIVSRMASSGGASRGSCTSVNTVCSDSDRAASLSSSASSASLQDAHSSSSSSSLPYGAVPTYSCPKRQGSDISLDLTPLSLLPGATPSTPLPKLSRLQRVVLEIVETEQAYVRDLKSIVEDYLGCIIDCGDLPLKPEEVSTLFCNIEDIYEFNSELLEDLERSPHAAAIAECFVERSEAFDIYTIYCMNYPNSVAVLRDCMKNECLVRFFQERQATLCHSLPVETYLLKPVQRILKYHLLLQELSKHFDKSDPGYEVVEDAIITMTAVAWYINDMKRKQEHAVRLQEIESLLQNWTGPDLSGFGELVLEGSFRVQRVKKERAFFLFDKMLLIAKKRLDHFIYSTHIFCCNLLLVENMKDPLCFKVSDQTIPKQQHIVQTKNQEEKRLWLHYLKRLIVENHPASLPQKARQVLGDTFCQSPQFDQEPNRKPAPSPRLDDAHGYHRGRRQSEPPEFIYTPEKAKKSLPLLLEGNMTYRRGRRLSAPAKDIEAAFQQSGDEGELCPQLDSLGSSGSTSTLASSVIEVDSGRDNLSLVQDDYEDLAPLPSPPTMSITEEIMQFINQNCVREGMAELSADVFEPKSETLDVQSAEPQDLDEHQQPQFVKEEDAQRKSPETKQAPLDVILDKEDDNGHSLLNLAADLPSELSSSASHLSEHKNQMEESTPSEHNQNDSSEPEEVIETAAPEEAEGQVAEDITAKDEISNATYSKEEAIQDTLAEPQTVCDHPSTTNSAENLQTSKAEAEQKLTKSDRQIIEKIRSYYEAAESEAVVEDGQMTRRNSFSHIPEGLVKDSVSRFNVFVHQDSLCDSESGRSDCNESDIMSPPSSLPDQNEKTSSQPDSTSAVHAVSQISQGQSHSESKFDDDEQICDFKPCMELWKEKERMAERLKASTCKEGRFAERKEASEIELSSINDKRTPILNKQPLPEQDLKTGREPKSPQETKKVGKLLQSPTGARDKVSSNGNLDGLPSQIKLGRFSRHGKVVTCSRTLYEGMADVPGLEFFEGGPVGQCVVENSEKILNKVQMLARMYTAKASSMKVPLHQKRTRGPWVGPNKANTPPKSQLLLHQAEVKTENQLSDVHMESAVASSLEPFGHVIVREQLSTTYHQENDCNLSGLKEQVIHLESVAIEAMSSSEATEEKLARDLGAVISQSFSENPLQKHELSCTEQATVSKADKAQSPTSSSDSQCDFLPEQKANHTLYSITEDHSVATEKPMCVKEDRLQRQLPPYKPAMPCYSDSMDECFTDPIAAQCLTEETDSAKDKNNSSLKPCKTILSSDEKVSEMQLQASVDPIDYPASCTEDCTPNVSQSSVDVNEASLAIVPSPYLNNWASEPTSNSEPQISLDVFEKSFSSQLQSQPSPTPSFTNVPSPLEPGDMQNPQPLKGMEALNNGLSVLSPPPTPPLCGSTTENLPKFTSQRPDNLPTAMGRRNVPANWNTLNVASSQRPQSQPWSKEQDQDTSSASLLSSNIPSFSNTSSGIPSGCSSEAERPSAFSTSLRIRSPSPIRSSQHLSPSSAASALAKSLAASCISQTISQSMAKRNARIQATSPSCSSSSPPSLASALRLRSPSPKAVTVDSCVPSDTGSIGIGLAGMGSEIPKCPPSPFCSNSLQSSPATVQSPPPFRSHQSMSPALPANFHSGPSAAQTRSDSFEQSHNSSLNGNNNNNNSLCSNGNHKKPSLSNIGGTPHLPDNQRGASHNRIARPFLSSEPNSRVQSPSPSPSPSPFTRICSPPLVQSSTGPLTTKPPNPRTPRQGVASHFTPLCLEFSRTNSACSLSPCPSPRVTSPPPIGIPTNIYCIASPQPRNPSTVTPSSPTRTEASSSSRGSRVISPCSASSLSSSQNQRRSRGSSLPFVSLASRSPSPSRNEYRSWAENGRWSVDIESNITSPRGRSYNGTPTCVSPGPQSPIRLTVGKNNHGGKHLTSIAWPDVHELLTKYNPEDSSECDMLTSSLCPESGQEDSELGKATCRSSLICAYVARTPPVPERDTLSQCLEEGKREDSAPLQRNKTLKTSYATTVNLQIAGSGRITSFSNAQVSLTQTLAPVTDSQGIRRVSVNGCSLSLPNCKRL